MTGTMGRSRIACAVLCTGFAGILGAHALGYLLVFRNPSIRGHVLVDTGHASYMSHAPSAVAIASLMAVVAALLTGFRARRGAGMKPFARLTGQLLAIQISGYAGLEIAERVAHGVPMTHVLSPTLWIGLALQAALATLAACVLVLLHRAGASIAAQMRGRSPSGSRFEIVLGLPTPRRLNHILDSSPSRGPPLAAVSA